jgi:surface antigen
MAERLTPQGLRGFVIALASGCGLLALLASCSQTGSVARSSSTPHNGVVLASQTPGGFIQCVPYARDVSGVQIFGDAWTWWSQANGRYERGATPTPGSVLTLRRTKRLSGGHVAVVASVLDSRRILVDHANWGDNSDTRGKIHVRQPVIDVSPRNDWSQVRFMNTLGTFGAIYPSYGFIYADRPIHTAQK